VLNVIVRQEISGKGLGVGVRVGGFVALFEWYVVRGVLVCCGGGRIFVWAVLVCLVFWVKLVGEGVWRGLVCGEAVAGLGVWSGIDFSVLGFGGCGGVVWRELRGAGGVYRGGLMGFGGWGWLAGCWLGWHIVV